MIPTKRESPEPVNVALRVLGGDAMYAQCPSFRVYHGQNVRVRALATNIGNVRVATTRAALANGSGAFEELAANAEVYFPVADTGNIWILASANVADGVQVTIKGTV